MTNLINLRKKRGYTQAQMAANIGISRQAYSNYELGNREPDNNTLLTIANFFDVSIDYLLGRDENEKPTGIADELPDDIKIIAGLVGRLSPEQLSPVLSIAANLGKLTPDQLTLVADVIKNMVK